MYVALVTHPEALTLTFAETFEALTSGAGGPRGTFWTGAVLIGWGMTTFMMTNALVFEIKQAMIEGMIKCEAPPASPSSSPPPSNTPTAPS